MCLVSDCATYTAVSGDGNALVQKIVFRRVFSIHISHVFIYVLVLLNNHGVLLYLVNYTFWFRNWAELTSGWQKWTERISTFLNRNVPPLGLKAKWSGALALCWGDYLLLRSTPWNNIQRHEMLTDEYWESFLITQRELIKQTNACWANVPCTWWCFSTGEDSEKNAKTYMVKPFIFCCPGTLKTEKAITLKSTFLKTHGSNHGNVNSLCIWSKLDCASVRSLCLHFSPIIRT